jgi:hypothetical protein
VAGDEVSAAASTATRGLAAIALAFALVLGAAGCGGITDEEFQQIIEEAQVCEPGDTCVLAGGGQCTCDQPVNADSVERVERAVQDLDCGGAVVDCIGFSNPRCENNRCVADQF